jgi:hypothetical protein
MYQEEEMMFKWKNKKTEVVVGSPGEVIPCDNPVNMVVFPKEPEVRCGFPIVEPDLSTKPKDIVGYCFGYACSKKHVDMYFDSITVDGYKERRVCQKCGGVSKPAIVKKVAEAVWRDYGIKSWVSLKDTFCATGPWTPHWYWKQFWRGEIGWTSYSFIRFLEPDRRKK